MQCSNTKEFRSPAMTKRVILHIGMHKTGSTSIQGFFSRNRHVLRAAGILYPYSEGPDGRRLPKHNAIFKAISHEADRGAPHPFYGPSAMVIEATARQIERSRARVAVLSAEGLSGEKPDFARALAPFRDRFEVTVVVFLRRPDQWLESFYRQMVMSREVREARPIDIFLAARSTQAHLDYLAMLRWWAEAFGPEAMRIAPFDPAAGAAPLERFLEVAGLPGWLRHLPAAAENLNPSQDEMTVADTRRANAREKGRKDADDETARVTLTTEERLGIARLLRGRWSGAATGASHEINAPPFIFEMLDTIEGVVK